MARLFTNHDPGHVHALLGSIALLHFLCRIGLAFTVGDAFPLPASPEAATPMLFLNCALVLVHAILPMASFLLPLPTKRNFKSPMIWPEFRLHSLTFASRHVLGTLFWLVVRHFKTPTEESLTKTPEEMLTTMMPARADGILDMPWWQFGIMMVVVQSTMYAATKITETWGDHEQRTTNAMPYNADVPHIEIQRAKRIYTYAQFQAAAFLFSGDPTVTFFALTGIQSAPLLMTLVRKGKCTTDTYHYIYSWSLFFPLFILLRLSEPAIVGGSAVSVVNRNATAFMAVLAVWLRTGPWNLQKHLVWVVAPCATGALVKWCVPLAILSYHALGWMLIIHCLGIKTLWIPSILNRPRSNMIGVILIALHWADLLVGQQYVTAKSE